MWIEELSFLDVCVRIEIWIYQISNPLEYLLSLRVTYPLSLTVIKVISRVTYPLSLIVMIISRTLTTPVPLLTCLRSIRDHAFIKSPYPVIITLEDHLTPDLQAKVAEVRVGCPFLSTFLRLYIIFTLLLTPFLSRTPFSSSRRLSKSLGRCCIILGQNA